MRNNASMPTGVWLKILLLSVLFHLLLLILFWPALKELFRDPEVIPGMQFDVTVSQRSVPEQVQPQREEPDRAPEKEPKPEKETEEPEKAEPETEPEPQPEPEPEEEMHLPRDTDETVDLDGTDTEAPEQEAPLREKQESNRAGEESSAERGSEEAPPSGGEQADVEEKQVEEPGEDQREPETQAGMDRVESRDTGEAAPPDSDSASMSLGETVPRQQPRAAPGIPDGALGGGGGIEPLKEEEMDAIRGESPVSEIEERRIRMANRYLARMKRQILAAWDQPETASARHKGEIRFSVDTRGYLRSSRVHLPSGHEELDESALRAVRSVERYRVPDSPSIVRQYYQTLRFSYSGAPVDNDQ